MQMLFYKTKAQFNDECFDIMDMFQKQRNFKVIFFAIDKHFRTHRDVCKWQGGSHAVKQHIDNIENVNRENAKNVKDEIDAQNLNQEKVHEIITEMAEQIQFLKQNQER